MFITILVAVSLVKLSFDNLGQIFHDGILTVREDAATMRSYAVSLKEKLQKTDLIGSFSRTAHRLTANIGGHLTTTNQ